MTMFKVTNVIVASTGVYTGTALCRSVKQATRLASCEAWHNLAVGDEKANYCSGIAMDYIVIHNARNGKVIYNGFLDDANF